ncbi:hypothetical protein BDN72DRAFT_213611 [Pluteus cervinus]|uniref:Uncharacterized protein n=1 Tax=Pluteus cervinus TaxID=181527 RepID=A0ACD3B617_9AGAR|nr:hypothetical protein BDN72DRAFT_213611 [Pluteus cervinus]
MRIHWLTHAPRNGKFMCFAHASYVPRGATVKPNCRTRVASHDEHIEEIPSRPHRQSCLPHSIIMFSQAKGFELVTRYFVPTTVSLMAFPSIFRLVPGLSQVFDVMHMKWSWPMCGLLVGNHITKSVHADPLPKLMTWRWLLGASRPNNTRKSSKPLPSLFRGS